MKKIIQFIVSFSFISLLFPLNVIAEDFLKGECTNTDDGVTRIQMLPVVDGTYFGTTFLHMKDKVLMQKGGEQTIIDLLSGEVFHEGKKRPIVCKFLNLDVLENKNNEDTEKVEQRKTNNIGATSEDKEVEVIQLLESIKSQIDNLEEKLDVIRTQGKGNTVDDVSDAGKGGESKVQRPGVYKAKCGLVFDDYYFDLEQFVIIAKMLEGGSIVLDDFKEGDWTQENIIGIEAIVNGNGNQATFNGRAWYRKVGNRIEIFGDKTPIPTNVSGEQFQEHFGLFPTVTCTAG
jgi:hypothetical protein